MPVILILPVGLIKMVDPVNFTDYHRTDFQLEETILFSVLVAGKTALVTAKNLDKLLQSLDWSEGKSPFEILKQHSLGILKQLLRTNGIGCYVSKARSLYQLVRSKINLRTCDVKELEEIHGIGFKTSRMFLLHTRPNVHHAALDTHILKHLASEGYNVPKSTPTSKKKYFELEKAFLDLAEKSGMSVAEYDLMLWNKHRRKLRD